MKIGILTYYGVHNHGAVLQANALKSVLQKMGHEVSFVSFERNYDYVLAGKAKKYQISLGSIPYYIGFLKEKGIGNVLYNVKKSQILKEFREANFSMVPYSEFNGDVTVVGSDEVFSVEIGYNAVMYGYGIKSNRLVSYAASFGPSTTEDIKQKERTEDIQKGLAQFNAISVRDRNSQNVVRDLSDKKVPLVIDPVLLYGYPEEQQQYIPNEKGYIAVYAYDSRMNDPEEVDAIKAYAREKGLKVYSIGFYHKWADRNINVSPLQLLGWIKNAAFVITDTFHGSVISIICNSKLVVKVRESNRNKLTSLLGEFDLSDRTIESFSEIDDVVQKEINFDHVNQLLAQKQKDSLKYLTNAIEGKDE